MRKTHVKTPTISNLKMRLWRVFTLYIKARDKYKCFTCGKWAEGQGMGGGHYIAKAACNPEYYFHEKNVHAQCTHCNLQLEGNRPRYRERIIEKYGMETLIDLETNYNKSIVWSIPKYQEMIQYYTKQLKEKY